MCISPISVTRNFKDGSSRVDVVPCGKCPECRAKAQSEFAALSVREAESAGKIGFLTLTYNNTWLPCLLAAQRLVVVRKEDGTEEVTNEVSIEGSGRGIFQPVESFVCKPFFRYVDDDSDGCTVEHFVTPSLCRKDVQLLIKRYRQDYFRRTGERLDFRFTFFGEYGERFHRPHYHMLVFGLDRPELQRFLSLWNYGFTDLKFITHFNPDGSDAFSKVSRYVSKYVGKRDMLPDFVQKGFAEIPRKQSSIRLGVRDLSGDELDRLKSFISPAMLQSLDMLRDQKL